MGAEAGTHTVTLELAALKLSTVGEKVALHASLSSRSLVLLSRASRGIRILSSKLKTH